MRGKGEECQVLAVASLEPGATQTLRTIFYITKCEIWLKKLLRRWYGRWSYENYIAYTG